MSQFLYSKCIIFGLIFIYGCGSSSNGSTLAASNPCYNEIGNGLTIINGPLAPTGEDYDSVFHSLTAHPTDSNTLIMGTERNGFVKTTDGGTTWIRYRSGLRHTGVVYPEIWDIAWDSNNTNILYAATLDSPGPISGDYPSSIAGIYKSSDAGQTWTRINCGLDSSRITSVQIDPSNSNIVLLGIQGGEASFSALFGQYYNGGLYRSSDAGANWSKIDINNSDDLKNGFLNIAYYGSSGNYYAFGLDSTEDSVTTPNIGLIFSSDSGSSWSSLGATVKSLNITSWDISNDGQTLYLNERDSYVIRKSTDGGSSWATSSINQANGPVAVSPSNANLVLFAGTNILYRSIDGLTTSSLIFDATQSINDIVFSPANNTVVYLATQGYLVYRSTDAGVSFTLMKNVRADVLNM